MSVFSGGDLVRLDSNLLATDEKIDELIAPYAYRIEGLVGEVVGYTNAAMHVHRPESALGNLLADFLLEHGLLFIDSTIDMAIFNNGGFRIPLPPGVITVGHIMELMPFDNTLVVASLSGEQMQQLAKQIVFSGGDPISAPNGVQVQKTQENLKLRLNAKEIDTHKRYRVLTSSYMAEGGDGYSVFTQSDSLYNSGILIREAIIASFRSSTSSKNPAHAKIEQRILIE